MSLSSIYNFGVYVICLISIVAYSLSAKETIGEERRLLFPTLLLGIVIAMLFGFRPITSGQYGDTLIYAFTYENIINDYVSFSLTEEWAWHDLMFFCKSCGLSASHFFIIVSSLYVLFTFLICYYLFPRGIWISFLFFIASFSFYAYGTNGIRNGLSCHLILITLPFFFSKKNVKVLLSCVAMIIAIGLHRSSYLIVLCMILAKVLKGNVNMALKIWGASILISLITGHIVGDFLWGMGLFDEKSNYFMEASARESASEFSQTGFRWDFLLYGAIPVFEIWYFKNKRKFEDGFYDFIATTYLLCNSFWILVIRAAFSNRFAYLSWFLYPLIIVYPFIRFKVNPYQNRYLALILLLYSSFTILMFLRG